MTLRRRRNHSFFSASIAFLLLLLPATMAVGYESNVFSPGDFDYDSNRPDTVQTAHEKKEASVMDSSPREHRPMLTHGPRDAYVVRNRPATLTCRALNSRKIRFKCNGQWVDQTKEVVKEGTDAVSNLPYFETSIPVYRKDVEMYNGLDGYKCQCYASSGKGEQAVRSDSALVKVAHLRKHFYNSPVSETFPEGKTVQLSCVPPDGDPKPMVVWLKNGVEVERGADPNVIVANDNSLIISAARVSDTGNYTCEARNIANRRSTDPAHIKISVDGGWSSWSSWTGVCERIDCIEMNERMARYKAEGGRMSDAIPKQLRTRLCNQPTPLNGGRPCSGPESQQNDCPTTCPVNGGWTSWSDWSECSAQCHKFRTRNCADPLPTNGGQHCIGRDLETRNCSRGYCAKGAVKASGSQGGIPLETSLAMYAGLACALFLFVAIVALIFWLLFRRRSCCSDRKQTDVYYPQNSGHLRTVFLQQPDLTQNALLVHTAGSIKAASSSYSPAPVKPSTGGHMSSFSLRSGRSSNSGYASSKPSRINGTAYLGSRAALIAESSSNGSSVDKQRSTSRSSHNSDENYATLYEFECEEEEPVTEDSTNALINVCPAQLLSDAFAYASIDETGGRVSLPSSAVSITVPEGALDRREDVFVAVSRNPSDRPFLSKETLLSAVIWTGPIGLSFRKPVIVSFLHCARLFPKDNWRVTLYASNATSTDDPTVWEPTVRLGEETLNTSMYCQMDLESCHVVTESLCRMVLVGRSKKEQQPQAAVKRAKIVAFAPLYPSTLDYSLRVYCVEDNSAALQAVIGDEERLGGYMVSDTRDFLVMQVGDLCCCLEDVSPGWRVKPGANYQEIPASHLWAGVPGLHCSFSLEISDGMHGRLKDNLSARIVVYQKGYADGRQILQINTAVALSALQWTPSSSLECDVSGNRNPYMAVRSNPAQMQALVSYDCFKLPFELKQTLCAYLDPPTETENDWRMLARKLSVDRYMPYFATRKSPTENILDLWEAREANSPQAVLQLLQTLNAMARPDAASLVDHFLLQRPLNT